MPIEDTLCGLDVESGAFNDCSSDRHEKQLNNGTWDGWVRAKNLNVNQSLHCNMCQCELKIGQQIQYN